MTDYIWANLTNGQSLSFSPTGDTLVFLAGDGDAASFSFVDDGTNTTITDSAGKAVTLAGVRLNALTTTNANFLDGSELEVGDNTTDTSFDDLPQTGASSIVGTTLDDVLLGRGGGDSISGAGGSDFINGNQGGDTISLAAGTGASFARGGQDNDAITGGAGANTMWGDLGNDTITLGTGVEFAQGNQGNDSITDAGAMGAGNTIRGGQGDDTVELNGATSGNAVIFGDKGADTLSGSDGADTITGGTGNDSITAHGDNDVANSVNGNAGNDTITDDANGGADTIRGGKDDDQITLLGDALDDSVFGDLGNDTLIATAGGGGSDTLAGNTGNDSINVGGASTLDSVLVSGGAGNDSITFDGSGNRLADTISGGEGDDTYNVTLGTTSDDTLLISDFNASGTDTMTLNVTGFDAAAFGTGTSKFALDSSSITLIDDSTTEQAQIITSGSRTITVSGSGTSLVAFNNSTTAASITGGTGNDFLASLTAADQITTGTGVDYVTAGGGNDTVIAADANGNDLFLGGTGEDQLNITAAANIDMDSAPGVGEFNGFETISISGSGAVVLNVTAAGYADGTDILATDTVTINASGSSSTLNLADGNNDIGVHVSVVGAQGNDTLDVSASTHEATISGGSGADQITGGTLADTIVGGAGNDTITGGNGIDSISADSGADDITLTTGSANYAYITNFTSNTDDLLAANGTFAWDNGTTDGTVDLNSGATLDAIHGADNNFSVGILGNDFATAGIIASFVAGNTTLAALETEAGTAMGTATDANFVNTDIFIVAIDDGTDTAIFHVDSDGAGDAIGAAEMELIAVLGGFSGDLVAADFDFT